jgi:hypothetical protein
MPVVNYDVKEFEAVPAGRYNVRLAGYKNGKTGANSKSPGADKTSVELTIVGAGDEFDGRKLFRTFTFSEGALYFFKEFAVAFGYDEDVFYEGAEIDTDAILDSLIGAEAVVDVVDEREYNGKRQNDITNVMSLDEASFSSR